MSDAARKWADQSVYDRDTARAMLAAGRYVYVVFCCQQAVEKALKAVIVARTNVFPPRVHNLVRLAEVAGIKLTDEHAQYLAELSAHYIQSRYPMRRAQQVYHSHEMSLLGLSTGRSR